MMKGDCIIKVVDAIQAGDVELLEDLWKAGAFDVNVELYNKETPLALAIRLQKVNMVNVLLELGANVATASSTTLTNCSVKKEDPARKVFPLQIAISTRNATIMERVFDKGPFLKYCSNNTQAFVCLAVQLKAYSLVNKVVRAALDEDMFLVSSVDLTDPLKTAVLQRDSKMVQLLIELGANVNRERYGMVPLVYAANNMDLKMCIALINNGAALNKCSRPLGTADTPLSYAIKGGLEQAVSMLLKLGSNASDTVDWSSHRPDLMLTLPAGSSMLHLAVAKQKLSIIRQLVSAGARMDQADDEGDTSLHLACKLPGDCSDIVGYLSDTKQLEDDMKGLKKSTSVLPCTFVNAQNKKGLTPLMVAIQEQKEELVKILLGAGSYPNICDHEKRTALHIAVELEEESIVEVLLDAGSNVDGCVTKGYRLTPLHLAVKINNWKAAGLLLQKEAKVDLLTQSKENLLHLAVMARSEDFVKLFLDKGVRVNAKTNSWETPLMLAVRQDNLDVCRMLLDHGAFLNACDKNQETALSLSVYFGFEENARLLIVNGADLNMADRRKTTPLYWSIFNCRINTLKLLLVAGVKFSLRDLYRYPKNLTVMKNKVLVAWIIRFLKEIPTLQDLCRKRIRRALIQGSKSTAIRPRVHTLPLPNKILQYLMFETEDLAWETADATGLDTK